MVKSIVKINNANGQKFVNISKDTPFKSGEVVEISEVKELTDKDLDKFYEDNKNKLQEFQDNLVKIVGDHSLTHEYKLAKWFKEEFNIEETSSYDEPYCLTCGDISPGFEGNPYDNSLFIAEPVGYIDLGKDEVEDMQFDDESQFDNNVMIYHEKADGYSFHPENIDKERILNSMKIKTYYELEEKAYNVTHKLTKELFKDLDFEHYCWGGEFSSHWSEFNDVFKHKDLDIYLCVPRGYYEVEKKNIFLCVDKKDSKEIYIN